MITKLLSNRLVITHRNPIKWQVITNHQLHWSSCQLTRASSRFQTKTPDNDGEWDDQSHGHQMSVQHVHAMSEHEHSNHGKQFNSRRSSNANQNHRHNDRNQHQAMNHTQNDHRHHQYQSDHGNRYKHNHTDDRKHRFNHEDGESDNNGKYNQRKKRMFNNGHHDSLKANNLHNYSGKQRCNIVKEIKQESQEIQQIVEQTLGRQNAKETRKKDNGKHKQVFEVTEENQYDVLNQSMTPCMSIPYEDQLRLKQKTVVMTIKGLAKELMELDRSIAVDRDGLPCFVEHIKLCRTPLWYRNMDEFTLRKGLDGNMVAGFFVFKKTDDPDKPEIMNIFPKKSVICKQSHVALAEAFQDYLRSRSCLKEFNECNEDGQWRSLWVRSNSKQEHMCIAKLNGKNLTNQQYNIEYERLKEYFEPIKDKLGIHSLYLQKYFSSKTKFGNESTRLVMGKKEPLVEYFAQKGKKKLPMHLHPDSFLLCNQDALESVRVVVEDHIKLSITANAVEWNAGCGVITSVLSPVFQRVIAIEPDLNVYNTLEHNTRKLKNVSLVSEPEGDTLRQVCGQLYSSTTVVINPGSSRLDSGACQTLRECQFVQKVIVICNGLDMKTLRLLLELTVRSGESQKFRGRPFLPVQVTPIDSFPQTLNYSAVITLERPIKNK